MTLTQTLLEIAALAAGAVGRHVAPAAARATRKTVSRVRKPREPRRKPKPQRPLEYVKVFDSVNIGAVGRLLSTSGDLVAAYDNGLYNNLSLARHDYPGHRIVTISVTPALGGDFLDVEPGCCWPPADAKAWLEERRRAGARFIGLYADRDAWDQLEAVPGIDLRGVIKWVADQTGIPHIPPGFDACQYDGSALDHNLRYDVSLFKVSALKDLPES
jgi:hypothetical protein